MPRTWGDLRRVDCGGGGNLGTSKADDVAHMNECMHGNQSSSVWSSRYAHEGGRVSYCFFFFLNKIKGLDPKMRVL